MGTMRRFAATLGIALWGWTLAPPAAAEPGPDEGEVESSANEGSSAQDDGDDRSTKEKLEARRETRRRYRENRSKNDEKKLAQRKERLQRNAKKLQDRADSLRKQAAAASDESQAKRLAERAEKFEAQAKRLQDRSQNLDQEPSPRRPSRARSAKGRKRLRDVRRAQLRRRWGRLLQNQEALAELGLHARRTARLKQIRKVARKAKKDAAAERAAKLLALEKKRHEARMRALQGSQPSGNETGSAKPSTPTSTTAQAEEKSQ